MTEKITKAGFLSKTGGAHRTRVLVRDEFQMLSRNAEDGLADDVFLDNYGEGPASANPVSSSIPSALTRWAEEGQILDPQSIHYCVASVKPEILPLLEKLQAEELEKEKAEEQKKKKEAEAKAAAAKKEEEEKKKQEGKSEAKEEAGTSSENQMEESTAASAEGMQVEQVPTNSPPSASILVSMHSDDGDTESAAVRSSTPISEEESTAPAAAGASVAQSIMGTATSEAASITSAVVSSQSEAAATPNAGTPTSSQSTEGTTASPMALVEEGPGDQSQESGPSRPGEGACRGNWQLVSGCGSEHGCCFFARPDVT